MRERHWYKYLDVYVLSEIALRTDGFQPCKVDLGSQIDSVQTNIVQESRGLSIVALASEAFARPRGPLKYRESLGLMTQTSPSF